MAANLHRQVQVGTSDTPALADGTKERARADDVTNGNIEAAHMKIKGEQTLPVVDHYRAATKIALLDENHRPGANRDNGVTSFSVEVEPQMATFAFTVVGPQGAKR